MPTLDGGLFILFLALGFGSLVISKKFGAVFAMIGGIGFFILALFMFANYDVAFVTHYEDGTNAWNQTSFIIGSNVEAEEIQQKIWIAWIFLLLGLISIALFFVELLGLGKPKREMFS